MHKVIIVACFVMVISTMVPLVNAGTMNVMKKKMDKNNNPSYLPVTSPQEQEEHKSTTTDSAIIATDKPIEEDMALPTSTWDDAKKYAPVIDRCGIAQKDLIGVNQCVNPWLNPFVIDQLYHRGINMTWMATFAGNWDALWDILGTDIKVTGARTNTNGCTSPFGDIQFMLLHAPDFHTRFFNEPGSGLRWYGDEHGTPEHILFAIVNPVHGFSQTYYANGTGSIIMQAPMDLGGGQIRLWFTQLGALWGGGHDFGREFTTSDIKFALILTRFYLDVNNPDNHIPYGVARFAALQRAKANNRTYEEEVLLRDPFTIPASSAWKNWLMITKAPEDFQTITETETCEVYLSNNLTAILEHNNKVARVMTPYKGMELHYGKEAVLHHERKRDSHYILKYRMIDPITNKVVFVTLPKPNPVAFERAFSQFVPLAVQEAVSPCSGVSQIVGFQLERIASQGFLWKAGPRASYLSTLWLNGTTTLHELGHDLTLKTIDFWPSTFGTHHEFGRGVIMIIPSLKMEIKAKILLTTTDDNEFRQNGVVQLFVANSAKVNLYCNATDTEPTSKTKAVGENDWELFRR